MSFKDFVRGVLLLWAFPLHAMSTHTLSSGEWSMISLPQSPAGATVGEIFGDDLAIADYGTGGSWIVYALTATEFGCSLTPNGSGTDHGWGGHNLVMGGAVNGADIYGRMPQLSFDSGEAVENNRIIPSTSVDQYGATLASWFGLNASELNSVFPNLNNFTTANLGFMS